MKKPPDVCSCGGFGFTLPGAPTRLPLQDSLLSLSFRRTYCMRTHPTPLCRGAWIPAAKYGPSISHPTGDPGG